MPTLNFRRWKQTFWTIACTSLLAFGSVAEAQNSSLLHAPMPNMLGPRPAMPAGVRFAAATQNGPNAMASPETTPPMDAATGYENANNGEARPPVYLGGASWTYQPAPPLRTFQINDIVTIRVDEITRMMADGQTQIRKQSLYEAVLTDWIRLTGFRLRPDEQANGDPAIGTESNNNYRAQSMIQSRESLTFNIAATVVDIRPNGLLVLEAKKKIRVNDNLWETSLIGICRAQDIAPDNVVLSKDLVEAEILKDDQGHLRDGYARGWFQRWFDRIQPF